MKDCENTGILLRISMKTWLPVCFILSLPLFPQQGACMDTNTQRFFESRYEEPVIESHGGEYKKTFPSFSLYSVFERKNLVEDPLIPDIWIRTGNGRFFESGNIEQALKDADLAPKNPDEALSFALAIVRIKYDCYYCIEDSDSFAGLIPDMYDKKPFYPTVEKHANGYTVRFHCYYPERRYAEFYSLYRKNLVEYIVTSTGNDYTVETGRVYRDGMDGEFQEIMQRYGTE